MCIQFRTRRLGGKYIIFNCIHLADKRRLIANIFRREPKPEDVEDLLCSLAVADMPYDPTQVKCLLDEAQRYQAKFIDMVSTTQKTKEDGERECQAMLGWD